MLFAHQADTRAPDVFRSSRGLLALLHGSRLLDFFVFHVALCRWFVDLLCRWFLLLLSSSSSSLLWLVACLLACLLGWLIGWLVVVVVAVVCGGGLLLLLLLSLVCCRCRLSLVLCWCHLFCVGRFVVSLFACVYLFIV